jgi:hypothetical protein
VKDTYYFLASLLIAVAAAVLFNVWGPKEQPQQQQLEIPVQILRTEMQVLKPADFSLYWKEDIPFPMYVQDGVIDTSMTVHLDTVVSSYEAIQELSSQLKDRRRAYAEARWKIYQRKTEETLAMDDSLYHRYWIAEYGPWVLRFSKQPEPIQTPSKQNGLLPFILLMAGFPIKREQWYARYHVNGQERTAIEWATSKQQMIEIVKKSVSIKDNLDLNPDTVVPLHWVEGMVATADNAKAVDKWA